MKDIKGTIKFYNTNLVKKTLGTGAFILVANISSYKPLTIICSVGAGLMIANIASKLNERRNEGKTNTSKKSKRSILADKLKEFKNELLETTPELSEKKIPVVSTPKVAKQNTLVKSAPVAKKQASTTYSESPLDRYIARQKQLKK